MSTTNPPEGSGPEHTENTEHTEYLESGSGSPVAGSSGRPARGGSPRRTALLAAGGILVLALVGAGVWAATSFIGQGPQPAEALPAGTLAYASVDLDPSGGQKIEAFRMLRKFPAIKEQLDQAGLVSADSDLKQKIFDSAQGAGACPDVSYTKDVEPWLGDRFAVAAVDLGDASPTPVMVVQVTDDAAAEDGLAKLKACAASAGSGDLTGWSINGDWAVIAETKGTAASVAERAARSNLADDEDYQKWTGEVGDAGVVNFYAAPDAGDYLADNLGKLGGMLGGPDFASSSGSSAYSSSPGITSDPIPPGVLDQLRDFKGLAGTLRFDGGALELAFAGDSTASNGLLGAGTTGGSVVSTLPDDTAVALGLGFPDGWAQKVLDRLTSMAGPQADQMLGQVEQETGLSLPGDLETLLGDAASVSLSGDFDPETFVNSSDGSDVPVGLKVEGDSDAIDQVLSKIATSSPQAGQVLQSDAKGDYVAIGPNSSYREQLLGGGDLGSSQVYQNVIREGDDADLVLFVNFDAGDWLSSLAGGDPTVKENVDPLQGLGLAAWREGDVTHSVVRLTTD